MRILRAFGMWLVRSLSSPAFGVQRSSGRLYAERSKASHHHQGRWHLISSRSSKAGGVVVRSNLTFRLGRSRCQARWWLELTIAAANGRWCPRYVAPEQGRGGRINSDQSLWPAAMRRGAATAAPGFVGDESCMKNSSSSSSCVPGTVLWFGSLCPLGTVLLCVPLGSFLPRAAVPTRPCVSRGAAPLAPSRNRALASRQILTF